MNISHRITRLIVISIALLGGLCVAPTAHAARIFFTPAASSKHVGDKFTVQVRLDTEGQPVNAGEIQLRFAPTSVVNVSAVSRAGSIFTLWIQEPVYSNANGTIMMTGGTPGGITTSNGLLATVTFSARAVGQGTLSVMPSSQILLNDGNGTPATLRASNATFDVQAVKAGASVSPTPVASSIVSPSTSVEPEPANTPAPDTKAPQRFQIFLDNDPDVFGGAWYVSFYTIDTGSGVEHYEIREERPWNWILRLFGKGTPAEFRVAKSPYLLQDQDRWSIITVRAFDFAGNKRDTIFYPHVLCLLLLVLGITAILIVLYYRRRKQKQKRPRRTA